MQNSWVIHRLHMSITTCVGHVCNSEHKLLAFGVSGVYKAVAALSAAALAIKQVAIAFRAKTLVFYAESLAHDIFGVNSIQKLLNTLRKMLRRCMHRDTLHQADADSQHNNSRHICERDTPKHMTQTSADETNQITRALHATCTCAIKSEARANNIAQTHYNISSCLLKHEQDSQLTSNMLLSWRLAQISLTLQCLAAQQNCKMSSVQYPLPVRLHKTIDIAIYFNYSNKTSSPLATARVVWVKSIMRWERLSVIA